MQLCIRHDTAVLIQVPSQNPLCFMGIWVPPIPPVLPLTTQPSVILPPLDSLDTCIIFLECNLATYYYYPPNWVAYMYTANMSNGIIISGKTGTLSLSVWISSIQQRKFWVNIFDVNEWIKIMVLWEGLKVRCQEKCLHIHHLKCLLILNDQTKCQLLFTLWCSWDRHRL